MLKRALGLCFIFCFCVSWLAFGADKHALTVDELIDLRQPLAPSISPDGRFVAYTDAQTNWADNEYEIQIWLVNAETGAPIKLTNSKGTNSNPAWSPVGHWLGFTSDRSGKSQLYVVSPPGGEPRQITNTDTGVWNFRWSPNGDRIAFTTPDPESEEIKKRKKRYSDFEIVRSDYRMTHLWIVDVSTRKILQITRGNEYTVGRFSWSPDGRRLAFDAEKNPTLAAEATANIYVCNLENGTVKKVINEQGPDRNPQWSPDGRSIAFETVMGRPNFFTQNIYLGVASAEGGPVTNITSNFNEGASLIGWGQDGIYFAAAQKTANHLFLVDPVKRTMQRISPQDGVVYSDFSFTPDFKRLAFIEADSNHYPEVYASPVGTFAPKRLTDYASQVKDFAFARREIISWKNSEGIPIEGVLIKPPDFDPTKNYPLLVVIHGGPGDTTSQAVLGAPSDYPEEIWAAKAALVLEPNYRGSAGYGAQFHRLLVRNIGAGVYDDIISGVDYLIERGWADKDRVGAMGWSFGGFISAWITTNSDRFKAVSVGAGPTDWVLYDASSILQGITRQYLNGNPSSDPEIYRESSPITYIKKAKTPTMIEHGEFDPVVPVGSAYELYQGLVDQSVPVRFYLYKGCGHIIETPKEHRAVMEHNLNWFNHYLWGEPDLEVHE